MALYKTVDLIGPALDWAVELAKAGGVAEPNANYWLEKWKDPARRVACECASSNWAQGGPIIEREGITIIKYSSLCEDLEEGCVWGAQAYGAVYWHDSATPLISAMRCYVAGKLGNEVEIPKELL